MQQVISNPASKYVNVIHLNNEKKLIDFFFYVCWLEDDVNLHTQKFKTYEEALDFSGDKASALIFIEVNLIFSFKGSTIKTSEYKLVRNHGINLLFEDKIESSVRFYCNKDSYRSDNVIINLKFDFITFDSILYESYQFYTYAYGRHFKKVNSFINNDILNGFKINYVHPVQQLYYLISELHIGKSNVYFTPESKEIFDLLFKFYTIHKNKVECHYKDGQKFKLYNIYNYYESLK